jgi:protein TonB
VIKFLGKLVLAVCIGAVQLAASQNDSIPEPALSKILDQPYTLAGIEVKPEFPGGLEEFYNYVATNYKMPKKTGLRGRVYMSFVIDKDGSITDVKILRDIGYGTGEEAKRVLENSPKWNPGMQQGKNVRVQYSLPITISTK